MKPVRLAPSFREKVWGSTDLEPWFPSSERKIGEVWFEHEPLLPVLVKFLFTSDNLSVQVHPDDDYAMRHENSRGKTEMWHILRADPGARIALGFREHVTRDRLREAALSGEIERVLNWIPVKAGETYFTPAGTVHAIGGGLALCEIQQQSDVTYRLYDYGRARELHLEKALAVAELGPHPGAAHITRIAEDRDLLVRCEYFQTELCHVGAGCEFPADARRAQLLILIEGKGKLDGARFTAGEAWLVPPGIPCRIDPEHAARLLRVAY